MTAEMLELPSEQNRVRFNKMPSDGSQGTREHQQQCCKLREVFWDVPQTQKWY